MPTHYRLICDVAWAASHFGGQLPTEVRMAPETWAALATDYYAGRDICRCKNCAPQSSDPMVIATVPVVMDLSAAEGVVTFIQGPLMAVVDDYSFATR